MPYLRGYTWQVCARILSLNCASVVPVSYQALAESRGVSRLLAIPLSGQAFPDASSSRTCLFRVVVLVAENKSRFVARNEEPSRQWTLARPLANVDGGSRTNNPLAFTVVGGSHAGESAYGPPRLAVQPLRVCEGSRERQMQTLLSLSVTPYACPMLKGKARGTCESGSAFRTRRDLASFDTRPSLRMRNEACTLGLC